MKTDATITKSSERVHFVCSPYFKAQLFEGAKKLDTTATELFKAAVREYLREHLDAPKAKSQ